MRVIATLGMLLVGLFLTACDAGKDRTPDYRYRLTVEVDTPEGLRTGSSVIEVRQRFGRSAADPSKPRIYRKVLGEAVAVDLPGERTLFALLRSESDVDWAKVVVQVLSPNFEGETYEERFDNVLLLDGEVEVPRMWPLTAIQGERSAYPMFVTFRDLDDPTSVERVDPDDLAASFGEGASLRRITVELTDDPVTTGIEERLGWLGQIKGRGYRREDFPENVPVGAFSEMFRKGR